MKQTRKLLSVLLLLLLVLTGCGQTANDPAKEEDPQKQEDTKQQETTDDQKQEEDQKTEAPKPSKLESISFADGQMYAVAFLGYGEKDTETWNRMQREYLDETDIPIHVISEGDIYLIIPRYTDMNLSISKIDPDTSKATKFYEEANAKPFLIQCNVSDIIQDAEITLTRNGESTTFTPFQSLKDGTIQVGEKGLNLIPDEPNE